ncbi:hypothetical protein ACLOJK_040436 [Asimina triloba]
MEMGGAITPLMEITAIVVHALPWMIARLLVWMPPIWREEMAGDMEDGSAHHGCHLGKMEQFRCSEQFFQYYISNSERTRRATKFMHLVQEKMSVEEYDIKGLAPLKIVEHDDILDRPHMIEREEDEQDRIRKKKKGAHVGGQSKKPIVGTNRAAPVEVVELGYLEATSGQYEELHEAEGEEVEQRPQMTALVQAANLQEAQVAEGVVTESEISEKPDEYDNESINSVEGNEYSHGDV